MKYLFYLTVAIIFVCFFLSFFPLISIHVSLVTFLTSLSVFSWLFLFRFSLSPLSYIRALSNYFRFRVFFSFFLFFFYSFAAASRCLAFISNFIALLSLNAFFFLLLFLSSCMILSYLHLLGLFHILIFIFFFFSLVSFFLRLLYFSFPIFSFFSSPLSLSSFPLLAQFASISLSRGPFFIHQNFSCIPYRVSSSSHAC